MDIDEPLPRREAWKLLPEPTIHPVKEYAMEDYVPPRSDGYERAKAQPDGDACIVIDNGESGIGTLKLPLLLLIAACRFFCCPRRLVI